MRRRLLPALLLIAAVLSPPSAVRSADAPPPSDWLSAHGRDHPLAGRIWAARTRRFIEPAALADALAALPFVLLGETHDNADHHRLQGWIVGALGARGRRPAVVFEMIAANRQQALARYLATPGADAAGIGAAVGWDRSGWPGWTHYAPIAEAALRAGAPIAAGNLPHGLIRRVIAEGFSALGPARVAALGLDAAMPDALLAGLREEIRTSHCDQLPAAMLPAMARAQQARDAEMAYAMAAHESAVLIAGNGHARSDRGVPWHLRRSAPGAGIAALGLFEVEHGLDEPAAYGEGPGAAGPPYDFVWFTPRADIEDPCARFAEQLRGMKRRNAPFK